MRRSMIYMGVMVWVILLVGFFMWMISDERQEVGCLSVGQLPLQYQGRKRIAPGESRGTDNQMNSCFEAHACLAKGDELNQLALLQRMALDDFTLSTVAGFSDEFERIVKDNYSARRTLYQGYEKLKTQLVMTNLVELESAARSMEIDEEMLKKHQIALRQLISRSWDASVMCGGEDLITRETCRVRYFKNMASRLESSGKHELATIVDDTCKHLEKLIDTPTGPVKSEFDAIFSRLKSLQHQFPNKADCDGVERTLELLRHNVGRYPAWGRPLQN